MINSALKEIPIELFRRGKYQTREDFNKCSLDELARSIKHNGIVQPIIARIVDNNQYEIVAGERRWRAAQIAGLSSILCMVGSYTDEQAAAATVIENVQRENLNIIEEAHAYKKVVDDLCYTQEEVAILYGKSRSHIANCLRLLKLEDSIQGLIRDGLLSFGHAKAILAVDQQHHYVLASSSVAQRWSVRRLEKEINNINRKIDRSNKESSYYRKLERVISEQIGAEVRIEHDEKTQGGWIKLKYYDADTFDGLLDKMSVENDELFD